MKNSAYIGNITVRSNYPIIVYGSVRGLISEHRSIDQAFSSQRKDQRACGSVGGYSDALVYVWENEDWAIYPPQ